MLRDRNELPIVPQCEDLALKAFYSELTEEDIEFLQRGNHIVLTCQDTSCPGYPCAYVANPSQK